MSSPRLRGLVYPRPDDAYVLTLPEGICNAYCMSSPRLNGPYTNVLSLPEGFSHRSSPRLGGRAGSVNTYFLSQADGFSNSYILTQSEGSEISISSPRLRGR